MAAPEPTPDPGDEGPGPSAQLAEPAGDPAMRSAVIAVACSAAALTLGALGVSGGRAALGAALGGALATANLWVFARLGDAFIARKGNTAPWSMIAAVKLVFVFGAIWVILERDLVPGLSLAVGYAALPLGITMGSLFGPKPEDDVKPPARRGPGAG
jgi:hypothetical protein